MGRFWWAPSFSETVQFILGVLEDKVMDAAFQFKLEALDEVTLRRVGLCHKSMYFLREIRLNKQHLGGVNDDRVCACV